MEILYRWIDGINDVLWSYLLVALLLGCAVWFTLRTRGMQFRMLGEMVRVLGESAGSGPRGERHVSSFQAFAVSLASRVGTGNLAGVATAIVYWVMFLTMVVYVCRHTYLRELMTWRVWEIPVWATLKKLAGIGFPGALAMLFEVTLFAAVALVVLGGGGAFAYIKFIRPKQASKVSADPDDYDFADEEEYINEDEPEPEEETEDTK